VGGVPANSFAGQQHDRVKTGDGVGGSLLVPLWAKLPTVPATPIQQAPGLSVSFRPFSVAVYRDLIWR